MVNLFPLTLPIHASSCNTVPPCPSQTILLQCLTLLKIVPNMTYNVFGGTLNPTLPSQTKEGTAVKEEEWWESTFREG